MPQSTRELNLPDESATVACGARLGAALTVLSEAPFVIHISGELGTGKTTLVRGALASVGVIGTVRSPTYTLVEIYDVDERRIAHLDLYRLQSPRELEALAVRELLAPGHVLFVEWPERGADELPAPDLSLQLRFAPQGRVLNVHALGRRAESVVQEWFR